MVFSVKESKMDRLWFKVWYQAVFWYLVLAWIALIDYVVRSIV